jgi:glucose 1-dehydrogenase
MRHEGKVAVVTGAANGIGLATARLLHERGARVLLSDLDGAKAQEEARRLDPEGRTALGMACDVQQRENVVAAIDQAESAFGPLDIMVNNAGLSFAKDVLELETEELGRILGINVYGAFFGTQEAARRMKKRGAGAIVNMSSMQGELVIPNQLPYGISKAGIIQMTRVFAVAMAKHGVRVNAVGPGTILTAASQRNVLQNEAARRSVLSRIPMGRLGDTREVASVISFLASDDASYVTGQCIYIDGGRQFLNLTVPVADAAAP